MEIGSGPSLETQLFAMKKATEVQGQSILKVLEDTALQTQQQVQQKNAADLTGLGQQLDLKG